MESVLHCQLSSDFDSITVDGPELRQSCKSGGSRIVFARSKSLQSACTSAYRGKSRCCMRHPNSGDVPLVRVKENMVKIDESIKFRTSSEQVYRGAWMVLSSKFSSLGRPSVLPNILLALSPVWRCCRSMQPLMMLSLVTWRKYRERLYWINNYIAKRRRKLGGGSFWSASMNVSWCLFSSASAQKGRVYLN